MSNLMSMKNLKNKVHRNGFDLSRRNLFTAKVGELLPVCVIPTLPGDSHKIRTNFESRSLPVNTAAFTRIKEYYDWFFVPYDILWDKFNQFITNVDNPTYAFSATSSSPSLKQLPYFSYSDYETLLFRMHHQFNATSSTTSPFPYCRNLFGFDRGLCSAKLGNYLGFGLLDNERMRDEDSQGRNFACSPFRFLAYQKIYQDYYRDSQWEEAEPWTCNLDYIYTNHQRYMNILDDYNEDNQEFFPSTLFDLRYCNWKKDLFMGVLPNQQYGDVATIRSSSYNTTDDGVVESKSSIIDLRKAEAQQKWSEIAMSGSRDFKSQMEKHWNVNLSEESSHKCKYVGGSSNILNIGEVINNNFADDNEALIKGIGHNKGDDFIEFNTNKYGLLMCIYHAEPVLDYITSGLPADVLNLDNTSFPIPEFDKIGMEGLPVSRISIPTDYAISVNNEFGANPILGYVPRYADWKTSFDEVHGNFVESDASWVAPLPWSWIDDSINPEYAVDGVSGDGVPIFNWTKFKVSPTILNSIFAVNANGNVNTDQLRISAYFDISSVRNLDRDGLPY